MACIICGQPLHLTVSGEHVCNPKTLAEIDRLDREATFDIEPDEADVPSLSTRLSEGFWMLSDEYEDGPLDKRQAALLGFDDDE
jgi:hypothetical protein